MEKDRLREDLERLHQELARSEEVDAAARGLLTDVLHDIEAVLERSEHETAEAGESLIDRLRETTSHFLNNFRKSGLIDFNKRLISILNPEKLAELSGAMA